MRFICSIVISGLVFCSLVLSSAVRIPLSAGGTSADPSTARSLAPRERSAGQEPATFSSCSIWLDNCGALSPSDASVFIADGAFNSTDSTLFFVDVPSGGDGVFQVDPATCQIVSGTYYSVNAGVSQRGIGYDPQFHRIWVGSWNDGYLNQHGANPPYPQVSQNYTGLGIAAIAVDDEHDFLFVAANAYPDMLYVYDITGGSLGELLGSWAVPWQSVHDGYDMAGMAYDDDRDMLLMVNQYGGGGYGGSYRETFGFDLFAGLDPVENCNLGYTDFAWGIAVVESTSSDSMLNAVSFHPDITGFAPPFDIDEYGIPAFDPPYDLSGFGYAWWGVIDLTWSNGDDYDAIHVYRDGCLVTVLPGDATSFTDYYTRLPRHYEVRGVVGDLEGGSASLNFFYWEWDIGFGFEESGEGFTAGGTAGWEWGEPSYGIQGNGWETVIGGSYPDGACGWLESPDIYSEWGVYLWFETHEEVECVNDGWNVQISTDGGESWSIIQPEYEGYDQGEPTGSCDEGLGGDTNCGDGVYRWWDFSLPDFDNTMFRFRILFESNEEVNATGVVMDNVGVFSGIDLPVTVRIQPLNPDEDGDGTPDVHLGEYLSYLITCINQTDEELDYAVDHIFYAGTACSGRDCFFARHGPQCAGTLEAWGSETRRFRVKIPSDPSLLDKNPWSVEELSWRCEGGAPEQWGGRSCFEVTLLPARHPPPEPVPPGEFVVEEVTEPVISE